MVTNGSQFFLRLCKSPVQNLGVFLKFSQLFLGIRSNFSLNLTKE